MKESRFVITCPKGLDDLVAKELHALHIDKDITTKLTAVSFTGSLRQAYACCLWSRIANRVLLSLATTNIDSEEALYHFVQQVDWSEHIDMSVGATFAVEVAGSSTVMPHTQYLALKTKDAIVDQFRDKTGERPSIERKKPSVRIYVFAHKDEVQLYIDLSGDSLHMRSYRKASVIAPIKENVAAAILMRAGWPEQFLETAGLVDPMCGSGTLLIEAALMANHIAPGLLRTYFGFLKWKQHDAEVWDDLVQQAQQQVSISKHQYFAYDEDEKSILATRINVQTAELSEQITIRKQSLHECTMPAGVDIGLVITNPPYGERLGDVKQLAFLYKELGSVLKQRFSGWHASIISANPDLLQHIGLRAHKKNAIYNGALVCRLSHYQISERKDKEPSALPDTENQPVTMFVNRINKNKKKLKSWLKKNKIHCYRIYDQDLPEYSVAVDVYNNWLSVQEYEAPISIDPIKSRERLQAVMQVLPDLLSIQKNKVILKQRKRQKGTSQYNKYNEQDHSFQVTENDLLFKVNLKDYLDTGLFLDHRSTRALIRDKCKGKDFLNLFAYTGAFTVYAAAGGAKSTTSIDMSNTYIDWAKQNMKLNGFNGNEHIFLQQDCIPWIERNTEKTKYDIIFLDPPTFSNSKRMEKIWDVKRDHEDLIANVMKLLRNKGELYFSTNLRKFKMSEVIMQNYQVKNITKQSIPKDFERNQRIHHCFLITAQSDL